MCLRDERRGKKGGREGKTRGSEREGPGPTLRGGFKSGRNDRPAEAR